jgi:hypothetical protein
MTKRYYSKRYPRKKRTKYLIVGIFLMFISLVVISAYSDIPQLEPIRKQMESFKSGTSGFGQSVGDTGVVDDVAITLLKYDIVDRYQYTHVRPKYEREKGWYDYEIVETVTPPAGAKFLFIYLKLENVGKIKKTFPHWCAPLECLDWDSKIHSNEIALHYAGASMDPHWIIFTLNLRGHSWNNIKQHPYSPPYKWTSSQDSLYPGGYNEGWIAFEVPVGIELEKTTLNIRGLVWRLG